jgi:glycosyltransferase involved in cell wall biosynthesis
MREETGKIRRMFASGSYDLVYSNTVTNGGVLESIATFGVPVVTHVHELAYWISRAGAKNLRQVLAHTSAYVAASRAVSENLVINHGIPEEKITVVYEHIRELPPVPTAENKEKARKAFGIPPGSFVVGGCGVEHWRKGRDLIPQLLLALRRLRQKDDFHFVWIGRPGNAEEESALRYDLRNGAVASLFHESGEVENPFTLFPAIDVFALLSREDPYPLACLEVAATETPVVCFARAGGMQEFVSDGCGFVVPYLDIEAMAQNIVRLAADPTLSLTCGRRARAKVARENTLETTAPKLLAIIDRIVTKGDRGSAFPAGTSS